MELRVHGIGAPDPSSVLGCAPDPSVVSWRSGRAARSVVRSAVGQRDVHVYHWAPLTSGSRSFAMWPLLLPFTLVNVAGWTAPPGSSDARRALHRAGTVWTGLATTAAAMVWLLVAAMAVWREVSGGARKGPPGDLSGLYFTAAAASAAVAMGALVLIATYMSTGFERFRPKGWPAQGRPWRWPWGVGASARLDDPYFYDNGEEHEVRWRIHLVTAALTFVAVVVVVYAGGTQRAGHFVGRALMVVGLLQALGIAMMAISGVLPGEGDDRRFTRRVLGASAAVLGTVLLGGLVLSALIAVTGIGEVPPGPIAVVYDSYGWAMLAGLAAAVVCLVVIMLTPVAAERGPARALLPNLSARLRARLATMLSSLDRVVTTFALAFAVVAAGAVALRWSAISDDTWRLTATPPVNIARSTFAFVLAFTVLNLVKSRASPDSLRRIGNVWDILTFWPRAYHPFAIRPYAERAVPELQEFLWSAPRHGGLTVAAHSQGSVLIYAAVRPFVHAPGGPSMPPFSLVTFGAPLRSLYNAVFPHYFDMAEIEATRQAIPGGWVNCFRFTDHIGRAVFVTDDEAAADYPPPPGSPDVPIGDARPPAGKVMGHNDYWPETTIRAAVAGPSDRSAP